MREGNQRLHVDAHGVGEADQDFEVRLDAGTVGGLARHLHITEGVGYGAGFLVEARGRKHNVGQRRGFSEEKILHDDEGVAQGSGIELEARNRIGAYDEQCAEVAFGGGLKHLRQRFAGRGGQVRVFCESARRGDRNIAGQQVREQAHVGCAAGIGMIAEIGEADIAALQSPGDKLVDGCAAELFAEDDDQRFLGQHRFAEIGFAGIEKCGQVLIAVCAEAPASPWPGDRA